MWEVWPWAVIAWGRVQPTILLYVGIAKVIFHDISYSIMVIFPIVIEREGNERDFQVRIRCFYDLQKNQFNPISTECPATFEATLVFLDRHVGPRRLGATLGDLEHGILCWLGQAAVWHQLGFLGWSGPRLCSFTWCKYQSVI
jgi:hypothetical protein